MGWIGALAGAGWFIGGVITARTGFSTAASRVLLGRLVRTIVVVIGGCEAMGRASSAPG